jgi:hypothetical protein
LRRRIAELLISQRVKERYELMQLPDGSTTWVMSPERVEPKGTEADVATFCELHAQRRVIERQLGPHELLCGMPTNFHHNGIGYVVHPYQAWTREWVAAFGCFPQVNGTWLNTRDTIIWYLWHYRKKALILTGPLSSKVRFFTMECVQCGHRRSPFGARRKAREPLRCPKCNQGGFKDVTPSVNARPFGSITRIGLRRRFRVRKREMQWILSAKLAKFPLEASLS